MTLEEAIKHCEEVAEANERSCKAKPHANLESYLECAAQHRQLAKWLEELKEIKQIIAQHDADSMPEDFWYIDKIREVVKT